MKKHIFFIILSLYCLCLAGCYQSQEQATQYTHLYGSSKETFEKLKPFEEVCGDKFTIERVPGGFTLRYNYYQGIFISYEDFLNDNLFWDNL